MKYKLLTLIKKFDDYFHSLFGPTRVAFYYENNIGFFCQLPIILELLKDKKKFKVSIIGVNKYEFKNSEYLTLFNDLFIPLRIAQFKKFHFVLVTDIPMFHLRRNYKLISMDHGPAFGNSDWGLKVCTDKQVDINFLLSQSHYNYIKTKLSLNMKPSYIIGYPKLDRLANKGYDKKRTITKYQLDSGKKTILIASHWSQHSILASFGDKLVDTICTLFPNFNVIQTAHNKIWTDPKFESYTLNSGRLREKLERLNKKHRNFQLIQTGNIHELLNTANLFITDVSSVIVEFSVLDKPILFFNNPSRQFTDQKALTLYKNASFEFTTIRDAIKAINASLSDPTLTHEGRTELKNYFLSNIGTSTKVVVKILKQLKKNPKT